MTLADSTFKFKGIPGWPGYFADTSGVIWSCLNDPDSRMRYGTLRRVGHRNGHYLAVRLCHPDGRMVGFSIHRLILLTFVGPPRRSTMECRHLNGNYFDNRLENLAWGTVKQNAADRAIHGTQQRGEKVHLAKLTEDLVRQIRALYAAGTKQVELARKFEVTQATISSIVLRKTWKHVKRSRNP